MPTSPRFAPAETPNEPSSDALERVLLAEREIRRLTAQRTVDLVLAHASEVSPTRFESRMLANRSFRAEVATLLRITEKTAETLIGNSKVLVEWFPATVDALRDGVISWQHAVVMVDELAACETEVTRKLEELALTRAAELTPNQLGRLLRLERERVAPETIPVRHTEAVKLRDVQVFDEPDGMASLSIRHNAATIHAIFDRISTAARAMNGPQEDRTAAQRRADLFTHVMLASVDGEVFGVVPDQHDDENFVTWFRNIHATITLTVPVLTLLGQSDEPATLNGRIPIDPATARILTASAPSFTRILTHPETGTVLSVGRKRYKPPKDLTRFLQTRDHTCRFPGCTRPAEHCDIDHTQDWQHGGETTHTNLAHLCRGHHTIKGNTTWTVTQSNDGTSTMTWTSPTGRTYTTRPHNPIEQHPTAA